VVKDELRSYIPLIPLVSFICLAATGKLPRHSARRRKLAAFFFAAGLA